MSAIKLDPKKLLGFRLGDVTASGLKLGDKVGTKDGAKTDR
ncbi:MAG: hypothetical protein ACU0DK_16035 [Pseudooceanicola sp.]